MPPSRISVVQDGEGRERGDAAKSGRSEGEGTERGDASRSEGEGRERGGDAADAKGSRIAVVQDGEGGERGDAAEGSQCVGGGLGLLALND